MHGAQEESEIMKSVVVFDYGFGNVRSMMRALANQDLDVTLTSDYRKALEPTVSSYRAWAHSVLHAGTAQGEWRQR